MASLDLSTSLKYLKGVGPARALQLEAKGLLTVEDLLAYPPFRYEDRRNLKPISQLAPGEMANVIGEVKSARLAGFRNRKLGLFELVVSDDSRARLACKWFHGGYLENVFTPGQRVSLFGKVEFDSYSGDLSMLHPEYEILSGDEDDGESSLHIGRIVPIHEAAGKVNAKLIRTLLRRILDELAPLPDALPVSIRESLAFPSRWDAVRETHFPGDEADPRLLNEFRAPAQRRLIFEEFFWLELGLLLKRSDSRRETGIAFELNDRVRERIKAMLPFKPTGAQKRALGEIAQDMAKPHPMQRLLQGDVGSGKTLVAAQAALIAIENGYQVALLAPTEILAAQHHLYFKNLFGPLGIEIAPLTGSLTAREKSQIKKLIAGNYVSMVVGTHALLEEDVDFHKLGLAIVDEQHRFGVLQRLKFVRKGIRPDVLVMTATPIPRTLALTMYGDLDTSIIDELPPGRRPIVTKHITDARVEEAYSFVYREVGYGRQAYVVYPLIDESEAASMKAAAQMHEHLSKVVFPNLAVGLLHGKLKPDEKEDVMRRFKSGELHILVATTVIEVGVDVPNATVMVIEQAERFGLAQLHQLRGRVGRGGEQSYCLLVTGKMSDAGRERIRTMVDTNDGFAIAEMDLRLRGPGEFFGTKQSGLPGLRFANLLRDQELLELARGASEKLLERPAADHELSKATAWVRENWQRKYGLVEAG
ncbi:MAG: ATP-dependent DNA helicase RecG [Bryobacteraceae bacterium]|nr:ATP-dependent DNA helicase RecG [Bryobacteraceae bacterium]